MTVTHEIYQIKKIQRPNPNRFLVIQDLAGAKIRERTLVNLINNLYEINTELVGLQPDPKKGNRIYTLIKT